MQSSGQAPETASGQQCAVTDVTPAPGAPRSQWPKALAALFSLGLIAATLAPVKENWRDEPKDSFPLSYYPMFSFKRSENYQVHYIVGFDKNGLRYLLPHRFAGSGGFNQTRRQLNKTVREKRAVELCKTIAARVARETDAPYCDIVTVKIVTGSYRFDDYFGGDIAPLSEKTRATAKVQRGAP
jgi:hypothetical protein